LTRDDSLSRAGNGDGVGWYRHKRQSKFKLDLSKEEDYTYIASRFRTMYWTLNFFKPAIYQIDYQAIRKEDSPQTSRTYTAAYTFGVDIDKGHGYDIHQPDVKKAVEEMAQFVADKLRQYIPNSVYVLFSGGGINVYVHHQVFSRYFEKFQDSEDWDLMLLVLLDAFDYLIEDLKNRFFEIHSEYFGKVKPDQLNNSQRVFKCIFSVHRKYDYAVIPLDPQNIKIDFEAAKLPIKKEVIDSAANWYANYDDGKDFLNFVMKPYLKLAYEKREHCRKITALDIEISKIPISSEMWPPCIRNILSLPFCGEGRTRALALVASFLGQVGVEESEAKKIFYGLAERWRAPTSNIFESYYKKMKCPTCKRMRASDNIGFPNGVSIFHLGVCKPDGRCVKVPSPRYYADKKANKERLKHKGS